jgi:hypothetical protein
MLLFRLGQGSFGSAKPLFERGPCRIRVREGAFRRGESLFDTPARFGFLLDLRLVLPLTICGLPGGNMPFT